MQPSSKSHLFKNIKNLTNLKLMNGIYSIHSMWHLINAPLPGDARGQLEGLWGLAS